MKKIALLFGFNSIKVQLEPPRYSSDSFQLSFQFHKGSIRTVLPLLSMPNKYCFNSIKVQLEHTARASYAAMRKVFQFHKGSIRTFTKISDAAAELCFNSIKVQLEPGRFDNQFDGPMFQFHKGSIRTHYDKDCNILVYNGVW